MKEFNQVVSKIAKSILSNGIRAYMLNQDFEQFTYWVEMANNYLQDFDHYASYKKIGNEFTVFAGSNLGDTWFKVVLDINFIEAV